MRREAGATGRSPTCASTADEKADLGEYLAAARHDLEQGRGFVVLDRLPVDRIPEREAIALYWMIGQLLGEPIAQNVQGTLLYDVRDSGQDVAEGARFSVTNYESSFHTDNSFGETVARLRRPALPEDGAVRRRQPGRQRPGRRRGAPPRASRGARDALPAVPRRPPRRRPGGGGADGPPAGDRARRARAALPLPPLLDRGRAREGRRAADLRPVARRSTGSTGC